MQHKDFATKEEELKLIRFYQNDLNSAKLLINVTHDKVVTDFSTATSVQIAFLKPDCKRVFQDVQNVNQMQGKYYVVLSTQTLIAYGNVIAQLRFTFPNNKVIETCKFAFTVDESIMSDEAMKSTNEFPVIQKAIEAGKKLEGVDMDGIIAAGAKADGALSKTGGTMTGTLIVEDSTGTSSLRVKSGDYLAGWQQRPDGLFRLIDWKKNASIMDYNPESNNIFFRVDTNLVKKSEAYTGFTDQAGKAKVINDVDLNTLIDSGQYTGQRLKNSPEGNTGFFYIEVIRYNSDNFSLQKATNFLSGVSFLRVKNNGAWGNWIQVADTTNMKLDITKPNGDSVIQATSGQDLTQLILDAGRGFRTVYAAGSALNTPSNLGFRGFSNMQGTVYGYAIGVTTDNKVWSNFINGTTWSGWKCVTGNDKDGRATLTLTADAENPDTAVPLIAIRRGNTVNLRGSVRIKSGATGTVVATLPVDMRPVDMQVTYETSFADNTPVKVVIFPNGNISVYTQNKSLYLAQSYVVD
ncbi:BppU family phage baseplate upper protein [Bacillus cereus]|nr:BppU family phage baseplate upper protein [Bacillus cereus]